MFYSVNIQTRKYTKKVKSVWSVRVGTPQRPLCRELSCGAAAEQKRSSGVHTGRDRATCTPAFLQIRPGKADYSDPFPLSLCCVGGGWGGIFLGLSGAVIWRCLFNTTEERGNREATWPCYPLCNCLLLTFCLVFVHFSIMMMNKHKWSWSLYWKCVSYVALCAFFIFFIYIYIYIYIYIKQKKTAYVWRDLRDAQASLTHVKWRQLGRAGS